MVDITIIIIKNPVKMGVLCPKTGIVDFEGIFDRRGNEDKVSTANILGHIKQHIVVYYLSTSQTTS